MPTQTDLLAACALIFLLGIPLVLKLVPPNRIYGFRTPTTLSRPDVWYRVNVFAGYALMLAAAATALIISCAPPLSDVAYVVIFVALIFCAMTASFVYLKRISQISST
ncbi:MAG TPA: SdpI family protein [Candidatus Binatia bacterium]|jgi:uncharacterized membrane protein